MTSCGVLKDRWAPHRPGIRTPRAQGEAPAYRPSLRRTRRGRSRRRSSARVPTDSTRRHPFLFPRIQDASPGTSGLSPNAAGRPREVGLCAVAGCRCGRVCYARLHDGRHGRGRCWNTLRGNARAIGQGSPCPLLSGSEPSSCPEPSVSASSSFSRAPIEDTRRRGGRRRKSPSYVVMNPSSLFAAPKETAIYARAGLPRSLRVARVILPPLNRRHCARHRYFPTRRRHNPALGS